jgi:ATP-dependent RNA helicase RhlE
MYSNSSMPSRNGGNGGRGAARPVYSSRRTPAPRGGGQRNNGGTYINPDRFIKAATGPIEEVKYVSEHAFVDFGFEPRLMANITSHGYVHPTAIQDGAIKFGLEGRDLIGLANTGTGKTAAFLLPIIDRMLKKDAKRALIMVPTRELAIQIEDEFRMFARGLNLYSTLVVGGASVHRQLQQLGKRPQFIIGTPGRLKDLLENYGITFEGVDTLVLDEADRMLDMGFIKDIKTILDYIPGQRQTYFLSATITSEIDGLLATMLNDPATVSVRKGETNDNIEQNVVEVEGRDAKFDKLVELLKQPEFKKVLIFGDTKHGVQRISDMLNQAGLRTSAIHGNKSQPQRQRALKEFKDERVQALVATDVAARGLDIPKVSHVINFEVPKTYDDYVHRIGRTGRAGEVGNALTFINPRRPQSDAPSRRY